MEGFFDLMATVSHETKKPAKAKKDAPSCETCKLELGCRSPRLRYTGDGEKSILIVGEQPSYEDDEAGTLGHGIEYDFLKSNLAEMGIDIAKDCYYTTAINCAPTKIRKPLYKEVTACRPRLLRLIERLQPRSIILMGETGYDALVEPRLTGRITGTPYTSFMGEHIPDQHYKAWLTPVWSVSTLMERRSYEDGNYSKPLYERDVAQYRMWKGHIAKACSLSSIIEADYRDQCMTTENMETALMWIREAMQWKRMAFDYETTGRKPHRKGHRIVSVSISDGFASYAFPFFDEPEFLDAWKALMLSDVEKIGQNIAFEMLWTYALLGYYPRNWTWDTLLGQHILHNQKPTGLKFMVYTTFGNPGYDDEVDKFLVATKVEEEEHGANSINQIHLAPMDKLLTYNALDSLYTFKLADVQRSCMPEFLYKGFRFFVESAQTLAIAQENGFHINMEKHHQVRANLDALMNVAKTRIMGNPVLEQWTEGVFNYQSSTQLSKLLFGILKIKPSGMTAGGKPSVDKEALEKMDVPIVQDILAYRKLSKMQDTYISQYAIEAVDGIVRPYFNINRADTFRSCVAKGSLVSVVRDYVKYPQGVPIEKVQVGDYVYSYNDDLKLTLKKVLWAGKTGHREVVRIHYKGGYAHSKALYLDVTPEHLVRTVNGEYVEAQALLKDYRDHSDPKWKYLPKSRVLSLARVGDRLFSTNAPEVLEHRFVYEFFANDALLPDDVIHHIDGNHLNHVMDNLQKLDKATHGALHYPNTLGTEESRKNNVEAIKQAHREGRCTYYSGIDNVNSLCLSRTQCLRLFVEHRGRLAKGKHDFTAYLKWCKFNDLDVHALQIRYNSKCEYISRWKLARAMKEGVRNAQKILGVGRYRPHQLCTHYGIDTAPYFRGSKYAISPWKNVALNNHQITKIEYLHDSVDVYDLEVEDTHNFIANEICVHNSSNAPNIQNQPKRDKDAKELLRSFIVPSKGNRIVERDYKSLEVVLNCCYSKDPSLIKYINDPTTDMHKDSAADCFLLKPEEVTKAIRNDVKGQFVFAEFYGSYYKQVAKDLWETAHTHDLVGHLADKGIRSFKDFERHIEEAERILWEERFPVHNEWREKQWKFYQKHGYVELLTGFRCYGPMRRNNTFNSPVQGAGYHVLQWTMNQVNKKVMRLDRSKLIGEIHDSCVSDEHDSEADLIDYWYWDYGTQKVREHWDWIIVPLTVEKEQSEIDGSWADMKDAGTLKGE